jgi:hypothetical protein
MNVRRLLVCFGLTLAALAAATVITTDNVHGEGRAVNHDGHSAEFHCDVTKVSHNDHSEVRGNFNFAMPAGDHRNVRLTVPHVDHLTVTDNVATFSGPGVLRMEGPGTHEFRGAVNVIATSNRHPHEDGDPDQISVRFVPTNSGDPSFAFDGTVTTGDIAVTTTKSY